MLEEGTRPVAESEQLGRPSDHVTPRRDEQKAAAKAQPKSSMMMRQKWVIKNPFLHVRLYVMMRQKWVIKNPFLHVSLYVLMRLWDGRTVTQGSQTTDPHTFGAVTAVH